MTFAEPLPAWVAITVIGVALLMGSLLSGSSAYVWIRKTVMGHGGGILAVLGTVLIVASVWGEVSVEAFGMKLKLSERLAQEIENDPDAAANIILRAISKHPQFSPTLARVSYEKSIPISQTGLVFTHRESGDDLVFKKMSLQEVQEAFGIQDVQWAHPASVKQIVGSKDFQWLAVELPASPENPGRGYRRLAD